MPFKPHFPPVYSPFADRGQAQPKMAPTPGKVSPAIKPPVRPVTPVITATSRPTFAPAAPPKPIFNAAVQRKPINNAIIQPASGKPSLAPNPDKLEYGKAARGTTAMMTLFRAHDLHVVSEFTFVSAGGFHAEELVILYLQLRVNGGHLVPQHTGAKDYILYLALSKSPCSSTSVPPTRNDGNPGCMERLINLNTNGLTRAGTLTVVTFAVQLSATKPYQPKIVGGKDASRDSYGGFGGAGGSGTFGFVR